VIALDLDASLFRRSARSQRALEGAGEVGDEAVLRGSPSTTVTLFPPRRPSRAGASRRALRERLPRPPSSNGSSFGATRTAGRRTPLRSNRRGALQRSRDDDTAARPVVTSLHVRSDRGDPRVRILPAALEIHAIRSSGPGGQNVNKVSSKILLLVDLAGIEGLDDVSRRRLLSIAGRRITADGRLQVTAGESRDRFRNLEAAREKVRQLVARSLVVPKPAAPRSPRRPPASAGFARRSTTPASRRCGVSAPWPGRSDGRRTSRDSLSVSLRLGLVAEDRRNLCGDFEEPGVWVRSQELPENASRLGLPAPGSVEERERRLSVGAGGEEPQLLLELPLGLLGRLIRAKTSPLRK